MFLLTRRVAQHQWLAAVAIILSMCNHVYRMEYRIYGATLAAYTDSPWKTIRLFFLFLNRISIQRKTPRENIENENERLLLLFFAILLRHYKSTSRDSMVKPNVYRHLFSSCFLKIVNVSKDRCLIFYPDISIDIMHNFWMEHVCPQFVYVYT